MTALEKLNHGLRTFAQDVAQGFFAITHSGLALLGLAVFCLVVTLTMRPDLRTAGEARLISWLQERQVEGTGFQSDFEAVDKYHVVRIGTGDYDSAVYQICGLQVTTSTDRLTGTGYRLSDGSAKALTADGKGFEDTADNDVIKLVRIDLDTPVITTYDADLNFSGRVIDSDDDWAIFDFDVHIEADAVVTLTGMAGQVPGAVV